MRRKKYEDLTLLPCLIADAVCGREYKGEEWSEALRSQPTVDRIEALRSKMTREQADEFCRIADDRCRRAYERKMPWFNKIVQARGDRGRDQLYVWITHWLAAYLVNPGSLK